MDQRQEIDAVINQLAAEGLLANFQNNCVLASDIIQHMLAAQGVQSQLVEVNLVVSRPDAHGVRATALVGYNMQTTGDNVATHVVVVTQSEQPMLIDASIGHLLRNPNQVVVAPANNTTDPSVLCQTRAGTIDLTYRIKQNIRLPSIHQKDLVTRLQSEHRLRTKVAWLSRVVIILLCIAVVNFVMNAGQIAALYGNTNEEVRK